jgi:hypothetical protein
MDVLGTSYVEALKYLAKKYAIEIQEGGKNAPAAAGAERRLPVHRFRLRQKPLYKLLNSKRATSATAYLKSAA